MYTTNLRKVGGSVMLAVPPALLDILEMQVGETVGIAVDGERLVIQPQRRNRYSLEELLKQCDATAPMSDEDRSWLGVASVGREL
jgi:antitoxin ChpS